MDQRFQPRYTCDSQGGSGTITFTREKLRLFKLSYAEALSQNLERFNFEGNVFLVSYAKYLIEYLDGKFSGQVVIH